MAIYSDKGMLELSMTAKMVAKLSQEPVGVPNDAVVELCCQRSDSMIISRIAQFYRGVHPIAAPVGLKLLQNAGILYAEAYLYARDPTYAKTYGDVAKFGQFKQAEMIMNQIQINKAVLYDNAGQPFVEGGIVSPDLNSYGWCNVPRLFGDNYVGDLLNGC